MLKKNVKKEEDERKVSIALLFFNDAFIKSAVLNKNVADTQKCIWSHTVKQHFYAHDKIYPNSKKGPR